MPGKILVLIAQDLSLSLEACLLFTCKKTYRKLGPWSRLSLQIKSDGNKAKRWQYLDLISQDCLTYVPCYFCNFLYKRKDTLLLTVCTQQARYLFEMRSIDTFGLAMWDWLWGQLAWVQSMVSHWRRCQRFLLQKSFMIRGRNSNFLYPVTSKSCETKLLVETKIKKIVKLAP